jgi:hypothetical protein
MPDKSNAPDPKSVKLGGRVQKAQKSMLKYIIAVRKELAKQQDKGNDAEMMRALERIEWRLAKADALSERIEENVKELMTGSDTVESDLVRDFTGIIREIDKNTRSMMKDAKVLDRSAPVAIRQMKKLEKTADTHEKALGALQNHLKQSQ